MKGECILYPSYFNSILRRNEGRKVPLFRAIKNPGIADLEKAAKKLGMKYRVEQKHHPAHWIRHEGRLVVVCASGKGKLLARISAALEVKK
jgi:signal recognition particle subunit SRP19